MKIIWTGTDSLMLIDVSKRHWTKKIYWKLFRKIAKLIDRYCQEHIAVNENVKNNLVKFGMKKNITIRENPVLYSEKMNKIKHTGFNILYYFPEKGMEIRFLKWLYGYDIFEMLKEELPECNFIVVNGSDDMTKIFPIIDFYIRPNRHDGSPRLVRECIINNIPYCHSITNPSLKDFYYEIKQIQGKSNV